MIHKIDAMCMGYLNFIIYIFRWYLTWFLLLLLTSACVTLRKGSWHFSRRNSWIKEYSMMIAMSHDPQSPVYCDGKTSWFPGIGWVWTPRTLHFHPACWAALTVNLIAGTQTISQAPWGHSFCVTLNTQCFALTIAGIGGRPGSLNWVINHQEGVHPVPTADLTLPLPRVSTSTLSWAIAGTPCGPRQPGIQSPPLHVCFPIVRCDL